ncbi:hypothetical protein BG259_21085 [Vibrio harveyi]|nr:hypothetical protein BG259_21085 [Vibrio harveyi]
MGRELASIGCLVFSLRVKEELNNGQGANTFGRSIDLDRLPVHLRFTSESEFESTNGYKYKSSLGKPYSALLDSQGWKLDGLFRNSIRSKVVTLTLLYPAFMVE